MKSIMNLLFLSCKKATEIIEKKKVVVLSFKEKVQLRIHKSICKACTSYERQSIIIDTSLKNLSEKHKKSDKPQLSPEAKSNIINKIKES